MTPEQLIIIAKARLRRAEAEQPPDVPPAGDMSQWQQTPPLSGRDDLSGAAAAVAKGAIKGATAIPGMVADVPFQVANMLGAEQPLPSQEQSAFLEKLFGKTPDHQTIENFAAAGAGALVPGGIAARVVPYASAKLAPYLQSLAAAPGAQLVGGISGEGARQVAEEAGAGPWGQVAAALAGGVGGGVGAQLAGDAMRGTGTALKRAFVEPSTLDGKKAIMGRKYLEVLDGKEHVVAEALRKYVSPVAGSEPTAGQAAASAGSTGFSAMQDLAQNARPSIKDAYVQRGKEQAGARLAQVHSVAKDNEALQIADALRKRHAAENYGPMSGDMVAPQADNALMELEIANATRQKGEALQDAGRFGTMALHQQNLSGGGTVEPPATNVGSVSRSAYPEEGMPVPDRALRSDDMPSNAQRVPEARGAVDDAMSVYENRKVEENWLLDMQAKLEQQSGGASLIGLDDFLGSPSIQAALRAAKSTADERRISFPASPDEPFSVQNLQDLKYALDQGIETARGAPQAGTATDANVGALNNTRNLFVQWLESKSPEWAAARKTFAADSDPINRMEIGQFMEKKLTGAMGEDAPQRAASYTSALDSSADLAKRSNTGTNRFRTVDDAFKHAPEELEKLRGVMEELQNDAVFVGLVTEGRQLLGGKLQPFTSSLDSAGHAKQPQFWNRIWSVANHIMDRARGKVDRKLAEEMAMELLDPKATGQAIEDAIAQRAATTRTAAGLRYRQAAQGSGIGAITGTAGNLEGE